ncbi:hypothetical protein [Bradyrhizobium jicamae]|uniref:hypothetical protein n=1 Tax=Bradyrhizobium jicamae TaxID=280332 RepID=UPI001BAB805F|nr:hypothetical protein [Bradyrhizobium jicamae]MBR0938059.1 hypothetical protein [Bradyrhizobium jicamae]
MKVKNIETVRALYLAGSIKVPFALPSRANVVAGIDLEMAVRQPWKHPLDFRNWVHGQNAGRVEDDGNTEAEDEEFAEHNHEEANRVAVSLILPDLAPGDPGGQSRVDAPPQPKPTLQKPMRSPIEA